MELSILKDIVIIFALSTVVNLVFTRFKIPTVVGYLLTGVIAGPHLLSLVSETHKIELIAEIGVVLLLFTIGMEFSLQHLLKIRKRAFLGGFLQVSVTAGVFLIVSRLFGMSWQEGIFIGFLASLSSSAIVLKMLQERSELTSNYGRTVLGILIFQDLLLAPLLLFTNLLADNSLDLQKEFLTLTFKVIIIIGLVYAGNRWLLPKLLHLIALTKNQELFMMSIFLICFAIALLTSKFGMSLAFGAFLAGLMISESEYSYNAFGNFQPIKDVFASFFFVSIGMLLDMTFVIDNYLIIILSVILLLVAKTIIAGSTGFILGHTLQGTVLIGLALSQVGEFSFVLAKIGFNNSIISDYYYHLFLAVAVITMAITPFLFYLSKPLVNTLLKLQLPRVVVEGLFPLKETDIPDFKNHLVIIGKDASAIKLSVMAKLNNLQHISIIFDPAIAREKMNNGDKVVYGDAVNEPILRKAHVDSADIVVISVGSLIPSMAIIDKIKRINKNAYVLARGTLIQNVELLYKAGADQVIPEKLEIAIDLLNRILIKRLVPQKQVNRILTHIRNTSLGEFSHKDIVNRPSVLDEFPNISISAVTVEKGSQAENKSLLDINLRKETGVTLLAIRRGIDIIEHPVPETTFHAGDITYLLGNPEQINYASELLLRKNQ
ncbi:MAG: sodium:proton exchanger [Bacteroidetes bacterium GWE2_41_25]|nr:MAG: sodium:proton exchanger [Bacteroidetes bacterium GWC2_40_22]OFY00904.1 MAG: sodium:proton exchanger [Bacteroidetes bacterium GWE2_41_25]HAM09553.1 sodium:proton exchanger [Bacteroidales bacterium]HBH84641.1 sodium:proton exchanger [Bacteroidales bacterium]HBQ81883.1 sodium:proton exchanger [Bacteroidales bacterium]